MPAPLRTPDSECDLTDRFKQAMSLFPSGVTILTAGRNTTRRGLTATAMCSVSVEPPTLLVCVNRAGEAHEAIAREKSFCVNILAEHNQAIADRFAGRSGAKGEDRFAGAAWLEMATGAPALADAMINIDCDVAERFPASTHTVFLGTVREVQVRDHRPLLHFDRRYLTLRDTMGGVI